MRLRVLWVSGWGFSAESFRPAAACLRVRGERRAAGVDHRFFDWTAGRTPEALLRALKTALVAARQEAGEKADHKRRGRVAVVAWSLGALAVLSLGPALLNGIDALVIVGGTPRFLRAPDWPHGWDARALERFRRRFVRRPVEAFGRFLRDVFGETPESIERVALPVADPSVQASAMAGLMLLERLDAREGLGDLRLPLYILHGAEDAIVPLSAASALRERLPQGSLTVWETAGHAPHLERPADFCAWLGTSLREVMDGGEPRP
ncbi:MAG: alpha/beta fold hydrolase [Hydrogenibacillus schlegelii]|uniref:Alpha/beta fold hydrolase n=1 Tax=Hydrogenibacillus schlegelii TaxID=1484 RepID=A0A947GA21_HYDSH|nr:alpha/beta fold hydrolase [Hydrogenibacillus schlegelii]MBT9282764.1 alpha/beta fold hydrolase [Hydrogenibacillus schlegelii]